MVNLKLIDNNPQYYEFIRKLRNDIRLNIGFIDKTFITEEMQKKYMKNHSNEYFICLRENVPVGYIGVVDKDLRLCVKYEEQKNGIASFMLKELMKKNIKFDVRVLPNNIASLNMFKKNGFKIIGIESKNNQKVYLLKQ